MYSRTRPVALNRRDKLLAGTHRFAHQAMGTTFEILVAHDDARYAEQAAWAAFDLLDRIEQELSRHIENSEISQINNLTARRPLRIGLHAFECLQISARMCAETKGAFDVTIGSLLEFWHAKRKTKRRLSSKKHRDARQRTSMALLKLNEMSHTVQLQKSPIRIDLGGIGKGYAVDKMAALLREWGLGAALIHGGYSSVLALDAPPRTDGWPVTLPGPGNPKQILARLSLCNRAVGGSGLQKGLHIIAPRTGRPIQDKCAAWACAPTAARTDALSTAFMVMSPSEIAQYCAEHGDVQALVVLRTGDAESQTLRFGL